MTFDAAKMWIEQYKIASFLPKKDGYEIRPYDKMKHIPFLKGLRETFAKKVPKKTFLPFLLTSCSRIDG
jgi:hypothetical protein